MCLFPFSTGKQINKKKSNGHQATTFGNPQRSEAQQVTRAPCGCQPRGAWQCSGRGHQRGAQSLMSTTLPLCLRGSCVARQQTLPLQRQWRRPLHRGCAAALCPQTAPPPLGARAAAVSSRREAQPMAKRGREVERGRERECVCVCVCACL